MKIPIDILVGPMELAMVQRLLDGGTFPPEVRDMMERYGRGGGAVGGAYFIVSSIVGLMFWVFVGGIFSTLGGLLGSLIFRTQTPPGTDRHHAPAVRRLLRRPLRSAARCYRQSTAEPKF